MDIKISPKLQSLVEIWEVEKEMWDIVVRRMNASAESLCALNKKIYACCQEEGVEISSLGLIKEK
jgi:hypothetical protein